MKWFQPKTFFSNVLLDLYHDISYRRKLARTFQVGRGLEVTYGKVQ